MFNRGSISSSSATRPTSISVTITPANDTSTNTVPALDTPTINLVLGLTNLDAVHCGVPTRTTPTLTPTTLKSIEQTFEEISKLEPPEAHTNQAGFVPPLVNPASSITTFISTIDKNHWGGSVATINRSVQPTSSTSNTKPLQVTSFIPGESGPVVDTSTKSRSSYFLDENSCDSTASTGSSSSTSHSMISQGSAAIYTPVLTSTGTNIITPAATPVPAILAAQVQNRRMGGRRPMRQERLTPEEEERRKLRRERNKQAAARCRKRRLDQTLLLQDETDSLEDKKSDLQSEIQILQQQRDELEFLLATHKPVCRRSLHSQPHQPQLHQDVATSGPVATTTFIPVSTNNVTVVKEELSDEDEEFMEVKAAPSHPKPRRPTSLAVRSMMLPRHSSVNDIGVSIETPSSGLRDLNFESMIEGHTGLTPVATSQHLSTGLTPLNTPVVSMPSANCGSQQRSSSSDLSSPESVPPKLVSL